MSIQADRQTDQIGWPALEVQDAEMSFPILHDEVPAQAVEIRVKSRNLGRIVGTVSLAFVIGGLAVQFARGPQAEPAKFPPADRAHVSRQAVYP